MSEKRAVSLTILPSGARGDINTRDYVNDAFRGGEFIVNLTAQGSTDAFPTIKIQGKIGDTTSYHTVGTITPATSTAFTKRLVIYPEATTALRSTEMEPAPTPHVVNEFLPPVWRASSTNSAGGCTYGLFVNLYA